nr:maltase 1-like isoform X1 [Leptinotarsa decemlineata]
MDSNGDGIGDIQGIISKLDHLKDAGITATWLSPIFKSPQIDQGYDISDYRNIDPLFGTTEDFKELLVLAKGIGLKIILDFVPNHTSDMHEWFMKSEDKIEGFEDFYVWHDGIPNGFPIPSVPNNWVSEFGGSAWQWSEKRQQYYYHQFAIQQPDLNYSNPKVVEEMKDILRYWLDQGVDGFRVDAVPYLFEDPHFRDEPLAYGHNSYDVNNKNCLDHIYTKDQEKTFDMIYQFREVVDQYSKDHNTETKVLMTEAYSPMEKLMLFYESEDGARKGAHFTFNFNFITDLKNTNITVTNIAKAIHKWLVYIPKGSTSNWVLGNHDNSRVATRLGRENVDGFNMLVALLPGVMVTYNGEEIGMEDGDVTCEEGFDPQAIKNCTTFNEISRDFERTPYQWDGTLNAGFSTANHTWLPVSEKAKYVNLASQNVLGISSHYNIYKELLKFRGRFSRPAYFDSLTVVELSSNVLQVIRKRNEEEYILLFNVGYSQEVFDFYKSKLTYRVVVASVNSTYVSGDEVDNHLLLNPHESIIIESTASSQ